MNIFMRELKANLKSLLIWSGIILLLIIMAVVKFSAFAGDPSMLKMLDSMPPAMLDALNMRGFNLTTLSGFYGIMFIYFGLMGAIAAAMWGSDSISKEERDKTVEFSLVLPVARARVITAKVLAALVNCVAFVLITWGGSLVAVHDPGFPTPRIAADGHTPAPDLMAAVAEADIITLHCPLDDSTRGFVNTAFLASMQRHAWLINTARGGLVDEAALAQALAAGVIEAAGVDVLVTEPPNPDNPLFKLPNVVLSPHNAAAPLECYAKMSRRAVSNLLDYFDGVIDPGYAVNPEVLKRNS